MLEEIKKRYKEIGLVVLAIIYAWAYLTRKDPFWAGRATFFGGFVILAVGLLAMVIENAVEKS